MRFLGIASLLLAPICAVGQTQPSARAADSLTPIARTDGKTLWIENGGIDWIELSNIVDLFERHHHLQTIKLKNIPGGIWLADKLLFGKFANKRVEVSGYCYSACALLALTGDPVILRPDATLLLHGVYRQAGDDPTRSELSRESAVTSLAWLIGRLPTIPPEALETALTYPDQHSQGLLISPSRSGSGRLKVRLCERIPDDCIPLRSIRPGESRLRVE